MVTCEQLEFDNTQDLPGDPYDNGMATQLCDSLLGENITSVGIRFTSGSSATTGTVSCVRWPNTAALNKTSAVNLLAAANHVFWTLDAASVVAGMYNPAEQSESNATLGNDLIGVVITGVDGAVNLAREDTNPTPLKQAYTMRINQANTEDSVLTYTISTGGSPPAAGGTRLPPPPIVLGGL